MKSIISLLCIILISSCASSRQTQLNEDYQELRAYLTKIDRYLKKHNIYTQRKMKIRFDINYIKKVSEIRNMNIVGLCLKRNNTNKILLNWNKWRVSSSQEKYWLLLHEIGHCYFDLEHVRNKRDIMAHRIPKTISSKDLSHSSAIFIRRLKRTRHYQALEY